MRSPNTNITETDLTTTSTIPVGGISGVMLITKRGPLGGKDNTIYTSWEQYKRVYGGYINNEANPAILMVQRALQRGSALRISRVTHYTDITDPDGYDADFSAPIATNVFTLSADPASGHTLTYTSGSAVSQVFTTDALTTINLLIGKMKAGFSTIHDVVYYPATKALHVMASGAAIAGDTLAGSGSGAPTVTRTTINSFRDTSGNTLFTLSPKYPGKDYDNLYIQKSAPSNGQAGYFNLTITFLGDSSVPVERYTNLTIPGAPTAPNSHYLDKIINESKLVNVIYADLSSIVTLPIVPIDMALSYHGGSDGGALTATDYIGDSSVKNGLYAFDGVDDVGQIGILDPDPGAAVHAAGAAYAHARKDLQYFIQLGEGVSTATEADLINERDSYSSIDTRFVMFFGGHLLVNDPQSGKIISIPALGDIFGMAGYSEKTYGGQLSFSGNNRGLFYDTLGADNNWGSKGNQTNLDALANAQINIVITRNKRNVLWGSFTGQRNESQLSFANVTRFHILLRKQLGPILETFLEEPCDIQLFKQIYNVGTPIMDDWKGKRAIHDYRWEGDQFASSFLDFKVNDPSQVALGNYKIRLFVKDVVSLQWLELEIILSPLGIEFGDLIPSVAA